LPAGQVSLVTTGLGPVVHCDARYAPPDRMDCRIKSGNDDGVHSAPLVVVPDESRVFPTSDLLESIPGKPGIGR
jgi:hypothetical protein